MRATPMQAILAMAACAACAGSDRDKPPPSANFVFEAGTPDTGDPADLDHDGYTPEGGDCYEGNPLINPGAFEYVGNNLDDDCDGIADNGYEDCDSLALDSTNPADAARAMNICPDRFLIKAEYKAPAKASQHRIAPNWGPNLAPRFGSSLFAMSTGLTLLPGEAGYTPTAPGTDHEQDYLRPTPYAFKASCPSASGKEVHDPADLQLTLKAPTNAKAFSFQIRFFTAEYPQYYCSAFNDGFAALLKSKGYANKNIAYGSEGEMLSVNVSFWAVCENKTESEPTYTGCKDPPETIAGSGFGPEGGQPHGATRWLTTTAPVEPGEEFTLRLILWDEGDGVLDSTVLLDNFQWDIEPAPKESTVEQPK